MKLQKIAYTIFLILFLSQVNVLQADEGDTVIYFKNGENVTGRIISQSMDEVLLLTSVRRIVIQKKHIKRIVYNDTIQNRHNRELKALKTRLQRDYRRGLRRKTYRIKSNWQEKERRRIKQEREVALQLLKRKALKIRLGVIWRSALLPGWGQFKRDERLKGGIFGFIFLSSAAAYHNARQNYLSANREYQNTTTILNANLLAQPTSTNIVFTTFLSQQMNDQRRRTAARSGAYGTALAGMYLVNLFDAAFFKNGPLSLQAGLGEAPAGESKYRSAFFIRAAFHGNF